MINLNLARVHSYLNNEIGTTSTGEADRAKAREIVFELISLEELLGQESDIAIKARIALVNKKISNPKFRINLNIPKADITDKKVYKLTKKELEVLALLPKGLSIRDMAKKMYLTEATVKSHMYSIYRKLEVSNRVQAIAKAIENRILEL